MHKNMRMIADLRGHVLFIDCVVDEMKQWRAFAGKTPVLRLVLMTMAVRMCAAVANPTKGPFH